MDVEKSMEAVMRLGERPICLHSFEDARITLGIIGQIQVCNATLYKADFLLNYIISLMLE